ncbi:hypothetical protein H696_05609 [Fonticula alba]|uniref:Phosphatidylethanolamine-binding protein n=1 Tax=Fonticula alba TaxID=691883 RepID=A0A058Z0U6_FONAL|nr:hypothetical protein H696_05609 [Fonticula alba]KCV67880.1 hypothetical protein H696_05609 [Fonticula alba]|eukprot:XP_009497700.1 hypothetical protein H696_05609 [Fonticula alba]
MLTRLVGSRPLASALRASHALTPRAAAFYASRADTYPEDVDEEEHLTPYDTSDEPYVLDPANKRLPAIGYLEAYDEARRFIYHHRKGLNQKADSLVPLIEAEEALVQKYKALVAGGSAEDARKYGPLINQHSKNMKLFRNERQKILTHLERTCFFRDQRIRHSLFDLISIDPFEENNEEFFRKYGNKHLVSLVEDGQIGQLFGLRPARRQGKFATWQSTVARMTENSFRHRRENTALVAALRGSLPGPLTTQLMVKFQHNTRVHFANMLDANETAEEPRIRFIPPVAGSALLQGQAPPSHYTLAMVDLDAPDAIQRAFRSRIHWLVKDIPVPVLDAAPAAPAPENVANVANGTVVVPYLAPHPERGSEVHRFAFLLFGQEAAGVAPDADALQALWDEAPALPSGGRLFDFPEFLTRAPGAVQRVHGACLFKSEWSPTVTELFDEGLFGEGATEQLFGRFQEGTRPDYTHDKWAHVARPVKVPVTSVGEKDAPSN